MNTNEKKPTLKKRIRIQSQAPTRIDLAGGTVDIWPLYLFLENPLTINLGISLFATAELEWAPLPDSDSVDYPILLRSEDQNQECRLRWQDLETLRSIQPQLELHFKLLRYFYQKRVSAGWNHSHYQLKLSTRAKSPAGAGLGGSSTLSIAMIGALATWASEETPTHPIEPHVQGEDFIEIVRDVETTVIRVPAGLQDYYGAMFGGLQSLKWGAGKHQREWLDPTLIGELEKRILLFYSGQSRNSGINNWALFKGFIDQQKEIPSRFQKISDATHQLQIALKNRDWKAIGDAIAQEWKTRKTLADGITTLEIDRAFEEASQVAPIAGKICGAGGGGCFFVYISGESSERDLLEQRQKIGEIFKRQGMQTLEFRGVPQGLEVHVTHEGV